MFLAHPARPSEDEGSVRVHPGCAEFRKDRLARGRETGVKGGRDARGLGDSILVRGSLSPGGAQQGAIVPVGDTGCHNLRRGTLLPCSRGRPGTWLNVPPCTGRPPQQGMILPNMPTWPRLKKLCSGHTAGSYREGSSGIKPKELFLYALQYNHS